jgi:hypothetical protein
MKDTDEIVLPYLKRLHELEYSEPKTNNEQLKRLIDGLRHCSKGGCDSCVLHNKECQTFRYHLTRYILPYLERIAKEEVDTFSVAIKSRDKFWNDRDAMKLSEEEIDTTNNCLTCDCWDSDSEGYTMPSCDKNYACHQKVKEDIDTTMRSFTKEETKQYEESVNEMFKPNGVNMFNDIDTTKELTTGQMICELEKNHKLKAKNENDVIVSVNDDCLIYDGSLEYAVTTFNDKWKLIPPVVEVVFVEAFKAYVKGKIIKSVKTNREYSMYERRITRGTDEEFDGTWIILD